MPTVMTVVALPTSAANSDCGSANTPGASGTLGTGDEADELRHGNPTGALPPAARWPRCSFTCAALRHAQCTVSPHSDGAAACCSTVTVPARPHDVPPPALPRGTQVCTAQTGASTVAHCRNGSPRAARGQWSPEWTLRHSLLCPALLGSALVGCGPGCRAGCGCSICGGRQCWRSDCATCGEER